MPIINDMDIETLKERVEHSVNAEGYFEISHATLRTCDLINAFMPWVPKEDAEALLEDFAAVFQYMNDHDDDFWNAGYGVVHDANVLLYDHLFALLDDLSPAGMYFGSNEGDGSAIGWWPCNYNDDYLEEW